ncbi:MAG: DUF2911 domain-containing protein [Bacteroidetes bacterium]|nr:DUF2911 domain-containing protein [Bacteroidota bacterium]
MKATSLFFIIALFAAVSISSAQQSPPKFIRISPHASVTQTVGITDMTVIYHRPGVKGREIWGKVVPFNEVWRSGANNATTFTFSNDVTINGASLKAGTYSFFTLPAENEWTIIFNSAVDQWGAFSYDSTKNVLTFKVKPETAPHEEWLSYSFSELTKNSAKVTLRWEKLSVSFTVSTDTYSNVMKEASSEANSGAGVAATFARYSLDTKTDWENGMKAVDKAIELNPSSGNYQLKANLYAQKEMYKEAVAAGETAVQLGKEQNVNTVNFEKALIDWKSKLPAAGKKKK